VFKLLKLLLTSHNTCDIYKPFRSTQIGHNLHKLRNLYY